MTATLDRIRQGQGFSSHQAGFSFTISKTVSREAQNLEKAGHQVHPHRHMHPVNSCFETILSPAPLMLP
jgi:hypothetical protein